MADAANKYSQNVSGAYYVDDQCIDCDLCSLKTTMSAHSVKKPSKAALSRPSVAMAKSNRGF